jgi:hypothetical protein
MGHPEWWRISERQMQVLRFAALRLAQNDKAFESLAVFAQDDQQF